MSLKQLILLGCLLAFIAPSFQYGTIFTDNVKPAFSDRTYFKGIKSEEVLTTDAAVGVIAAENLGGFSINTPGTVTSTADTHSFTSAQIIEFTSSEVLNVLSAGTLNVAAHRTDVDAQSFSFAGQGDASLHGLSSTIRAAYFNLNTTGNAAVRATGDALDFSAPLFIGFAAVDNATVTANNNIVFDSDASFVDFSGQSGLITPNYFSSNGELDSFITTNQFTMEAKAIADISSLTTLQVIGEKLDLVVDSGDINIIAPSGLRFSGNDSTTDQTYTSTFQSHSNLHLDSKGSTASIIQLDQTGEVQLVADNTITFATFFGESGLTFDSDIDLTYTSTDISNTVVRAQYIAADSLLGTASNTVYISVPSEDLFIKTAIGDITFASDRNDVTLNTEDDLVASAVNTYIDTLDDISIVATSTLFEQNNPDSENGILRIDALTQSVLNATVFEINSAGSNEFNAGTLYYATGLDVSVVGNKAVDEIVFSTSRQTSIAAIDNLTYRGEHITISSTTFTSETTGKYDVAAFDFDVNAEDVTLNADTLTIRSVRDAIVFNTQSVATLTAQSLHHTGYNIEFINPDFEINSSGPVTVSADSNFSWNAANNVEITTPASTIAATQSSQFLTNKFTETSPAVAISGATAYLSQNLPSDTLSIVTDELTINGDYFDIVSGGNVIVTNDVLSTTGLGSYTLSASASINYNIADDLNVLTNSQSTFRSGGELNFQIEGPINFDNDNDITINGPRGENAFVSFHTSDISYNTDFITLSGSDVLVSAGNVDIVDTTGFRLVGENQYGDLFINSEDSTVTFNADDALSISAAGILTYHSEDELTLVSDETTIATGIYDTIAPVHTVTSGTFTMEGLTVGDDNTIVFDGETFTSTVSMRTDIEADISASFYSGNTLDFNIEQSIVITSLDLIIDGFSSVTFESEDLEIDTDLTELNIVSGGESNYYIAGDLFHDSFGDFATESFTTRAEVGGSVSFTAQAGPIIDSATDGEIHYITDAQDVNAELGNVVYQSSGNIEINSATLFEANGVLAGFTTAISIESSEIDGNIVFDSEVGNIIISASNDETITSNGFGSITAALGISYDVTGTLDASAGENIDIKSFSHTTFETTLNADYLIGDYANFEAGRNIRFTSDLSTALSSVTEFTVSTGEQGDLNIFSQGKLLFSTSGNQDFHSSGDYSWQASDDFSNDADKDLDLHTTGGPIQISTTTGDITYDIGGDFNWRSGEDLIYDNDGDYTLTSTSNIQSLAERGDITIDASSDLKFTAETGDITLLSLGNRDKNIPFEDIIDGVRLTSFDTSFTFTNSFSLYPANVLHFGGETQPDLTIAASGSQSTTGFTLDSDGHVSISSTETIDFSQVNLFINSREYVHFGADGEQGITSTNTISAKADAGHVRFYSGRDFTETAETSITDTATGGYFLFTNNNKEDTTTYELSFESLNNNVVMSGNLLTEDIDESLHGTINDIFFTITNAVSFSTTEGDNGSLEFATTTGALSMSAKGSVTGQVTGPGGAFRVDAGSLSVTTLKSSDITLHTAGTFESYIKSTATYTTTAGAVAIQSLSVDGADYTQGDIHFSSTTGDIELLSADTTDITADGSVYLNSTDTTLTAIDIIYESFDDSILFGESYLGTTALLTMGNTDGNGGDINFTTGSYYQTGTLTWDISDDVNAKFAGNVTGFSEGTTTFTASSKTNTQNSFSLITTAKDADIYFSTGDINGQLGVTIDNDITFDITGTIKSVAGLYTEFLSNTAINVTSSGGNFVFNTTRSSIETQVFLDTNFLADSGIITMEANGIDPSSDFGIYIYGNSKVAGTAEENTIVLSSAELLSLRAYEAVEFRTDFRTIIGSQDPVTFTSVTANSTSRTTFITTGLESSILFNTRVPEDGVVGKLSIIGTPIIDIVTCQAGLNDNVESYPVWGQNGVVDFVASETIRFEQVSGISFEGRFGDFLKESSAGLFDCATEYGTELNTDPSDAFYYSQGAFAGIEISTTGGFSDIEFYINTIAVFDADDELILGSTGETTSFVELSSLKGAINFQVLSTNTSDAIEVHAYNGRIYMDANNYGNILFVPQNNIYFTAVRGIELEGNTVNGAAQNIQFISRSGHINVAADTVVAQAPAIVIGSSTDAPADDRYYGDIFISATASTIESPEILIRSTNGDIRFDFGKDADFSGVTDVFFTKPNALRLPMKQESITPGTECQIPSQVAIAHNSFYSDGEGELEGTKDTGIMICWCSTYELHWYCRTLSPALPYN